MPIWVAKEAAKFCAIKEEEKLRAALLDWLQDIPPEQLPRLTFGQIEPDSLEISILSIKYDDQEIEVALQIWFRETLAGSSCGFEASSDAGYAEVILAIDCATCTARLM